MLVKWLFKMLSPEYLCTSVSNKNMFYIHYLYCSSFSLHACHSVSPMPLDRSFWQSESEVACTSIIVERWYVVHSFHYFWHGNKTICCLKNASVEVKTWLTLGWLGPKLCKELKFMLKFGWLQWDSDIFNKKAKRTWASVQSRIDCLLFLTYLIINWGFRIQG